MVLIFQRRTHRIAAKFLLCLKQIGLLDMKVFMLDMNQVNLLTYVSDLTL